MALARRARTCGGGGREERGEGEEGRKGGEQGGEGDAEREEETGEGEEVNKLRGASFHSTVIAHPTFSPPPLSRAFAPRSLSPARALSVYTYIVEKWSA